MNILDPWNLIFFAGLVVYVGIRHVFIGRTKDVKKTVSRMDGQEKVLIFLMVPVIMLLPVLYLFTPLLAFADYRLPVAVMAVGAATMVCSLWFFWRSHVDLGRNWSVSIELSEEHQLITKGVYASIRHPMYSSIWLWGLGQGMLLQNWLAGWLVIPVFALMYFLRVPREEQLMEECFGEQYRDYMKRTGRLMPSLKSKGGD